MSFTPDPNATPPPVESEPPRADSGSALGISAMIFAVLAPPVGLVLSLVDRSGVKRGGQRPSALNTAALAVSSSLVALGLLAAIATVIFFAVVASQVAAVLPGEQSQVTETALPDNAGAVVTVELTGDFDELGSIPALLEARLARAGLETLEVIEVRSGVWEVILAKGRASEQAEYAAQLLRAPVEGGLRAVAAIGEPTAGGGGSFRADVTQVLAEEFVAIDCADTLAGPIEVGAGYLVACSTDLQSKYLLAEPLALSSEIGEVSQRSTALEITLDVNGTAALQRFSEEAVANPSAVANLVSVYAGGEVLTAPQIQGVITNGFIRVEDPNGDAIAIRRAETTLRIAQIGGTFQTASVSVVD